MKNTWKPGDHARLTFSGHMVTLVKKMPFGKHDDYWWVHTHDNQWKGTVSDLSLRPIDEPAPTEQGAQLAMF